MKLNSKKIKNEKWYYEQYCKLNKSVKQIRRETGLGVNTIKRWFKFYGIEIIERNDLKGHQKENHPNWKGQKRNNGYNYVYFPEHPNSGKAGYASEHRMVASKMLNRPLTKDDVVHHKDGGRLNNKKSNLFPTNKAGHRKAEASLMRVGYELYESGKLKFEKGVYKWM